MKCVYGLPIYYSITPCISLALAGAEVPVVCESDVLGLVTELIMDFISGQRSVYLEFYDIFDDRVLMGASAGSLCFLIECLEIVKSLFFCGFFQVKDC